MQRPLISVIVPVYNVEEFLNRCVDSIIRQTYQELEIILVDDGSTDNSGALCDEYVQKDSRIVVIHKENGGLSDARNAAIEIMKGEFVAYVDSDDYLADDYIAYMYNLLISENADISACAIKTVCDYTEQLGVINEKIVIYDAYEALKAILYQGCFVPSACCKLYKKELFEDIRYPKGMYYEDMAIIYKLLDKCQKVVIGNQQKYYYYQRANSIMNESFNPKKMHRIQIVNELKKHVDNRYPELKKATSARCFKVGLLTYQEIPYKKQYREYIDTAWKQIQEYRWETIKNNEAGILLRLIAISTFLGKRVVSILGDLQAIIFKN